MTECRAQEAVSSSPQQDTEASYFFETKERPKHGTFWSVQRVNWPPLPYNPFPDLPLYSLDTRSADFWYDDRGVDYELLDQERKAIRQMKAASLGMMLAEFDEAESGGPMFCAYEYATNDLYLEIGQDGTNALLLSHSLVVHTPETNGIYDLYWNSELGSTTPWMRLTRTEPGQTNVIVTPPESPTGFFRLGTLLDADGDSIPNAYEYLVTQTDPAVMDTPTSLGTNNWLLNEEGSGLRVSSMTMHKNEQETWSPCPDGLTPTDIVIALAWARGATGTYTWSHHIEQCSNGTVVVAVHTNGVSPFDGSTTLPLHFSWHLDLISGETNLTLFDWSYDTRVEWLTGGLPLSAKQWPWIITGSATNLMPSAEFLVRSNTIPPTAITIAGKTLNTNGEAVLILRDNSANNFTPSVAGFNNYWYAVNAAKVKVPLQFRNEGELTPAETNGAGFHASTYTSLTNLVKTTTLGSGNPAVSNWISPNFFFNIEETDANVPATVLLDSGWSWHRDAYAVVFTWSEQFPYSVNAATAKTFTLGTPGEISGNDNFDIKDENPDLNRLILQVDIPGLGFEFTNSTSYGIIKSYQLYAREWLTWEGASASDILRWRSVLTVRAAPGQAFARSGPNVIELTPAGSSEKPWLSYQEAQQIYNGP